MLDFTVVPPSVEVSVPCVVEGFEVGEVVVIHLFEGLVEEVVKFITAVVVAASLAWAIFFTDVSISCEEQWLVGTTAACLFISWVATSSVDWLSIFIVGRNEVLTSEAAIIRVRNWH